MILPAISAASQTPLVYRAAEQELLRNVMGATGVARSPAGPEPTGYFAALARAFARWLGKLFSSQPGLADGLRIAVAAFAIAAVGLGLGLLAVAILRRVRARRGSVESAVERLGWTETPDGASALDRSGWKAEMESRLSRGDVAGALEALWWWLAAALTLDEPVDASWTTRELLVRARRPELLRSGAVLDTLMYGRRSPSAGDVGACLARFEGEIP